MEDYWHGMKDFRYGRFILHSILCTCTQVANYV